MSRVSISHTLEDSQNIVYYLIAFSAHVDSLIFGEHEEVKEMKPHISKMKNITNR